MEIVFKENPFGWELLYNIIKHQLHTKSDVIISLIHWILTRRGFLCAGIGQDNMIPQYSMLTELLPNAWNVTSTYMLRYVYEKKLYLLTANKQKCLDEFIINFNCPLDGKISEVTIKADSVKQINGRLNEMIPNYEEIIFKVNNELINKLLRTETNRKAQTQTRDLDTETSEPPNCTRRLSNFQLPTPPMFVLPRVGSTDRSPFSPGGGMLMPPPGMGPRPLFTDPFQIDPTLPRGAVPPGARFDPIRPFYEPPRPTRPFNPDHNHFPPP